MLDDAGRMVASFTVAHSADGFEELVKRLRRVQDPPGLPVARAPRRAPGGPPAAGGSHTVVPVSSNAIKAWREAEVLSGAKSDPGDAEVITEYLHLRFHHLNQLTPFSQEIAYKIVQQDLDVWSEPRRPRAPVRGRAEVGPARSLFDVRRRYSCMAC